MVARAIDWLVGTAWGNLSLISSLFWLTWGYCASIKGWVIDDIEGIAKFSDKFLQYKDATGAIVKEELVDSYDQEVGKDDKGQPINKKFKHTQFNPHIGFPGSLFRWLRLIYGRSFIELGKNMKGHPVYGWSQDSRKHHLLNLIFQQTNLILGYFFLAPLIGPKLTFFSLLIFAVHPICIQAIAWISGINYTISLSFILATLLIGQNITNPYAVIALSTFTLNIACLFFLPACFTWMICLFLHQWDMAIITFLIGTAHALTYGRGVMAYRVDAFKKQQMEKTTQVGWRKIIVLFKTIWYYFLFLPFPKRLGLFHSWGYHFEEPLEHVDHLFFKGVAVTLGSILLLLFAPFAIKLAILWIGVYFILFLNLLTAQQFVSERYAYLPSFGYCIIMAYVLHYLPPVLYLILGAYIMRVWIHLPSFRNEVRFYESNANNFPESEIAIGNLGVAYLNHGLPGKAVDTWLEATRMNPTYDVPWYNLYSFSKQQGDIVQAREFLKKCFDAKIIHFPEQWKKEMDELDKLLASRQASVPQVKPVSPPQPTIKCQ